MSRICICKHCKKNKQFVDYYEFKDLYNIRDSGDTHEVALYYPHPSERGYVTPHMWFRRFMYESSFWGFVFAVYGTCEIREYDGQGEYGNKYNSICDYTISYTKFKEIGKYYETSIKKLYKDLFNLDVDIEKIERFNKDSKKYIKNLFKGININI